MLDDDHNSVPEPTPGRVTDVCQPVTHVYRITPQSMHLTCVTWHTPQYHDGVQDRFPYVSHAGTVPQRVTRHTLRVEHRSFCFPPARVSSVTRHGVPACDNSLPNERTCDLAHVTPCVWSTVRSVFHPPMGIPIGEDPPAGSAEQHSFGVLAQCMALLQHVLIPP